MESMLGRVGRMANLSPRAQEWAWKGVYSLSIGPA